MSTRHSLSLRTRVLLVITLGVVLPLALVGLWVAQTTRGSGEAFLRERLEGSLGEAVQTLGHGWVGLRGQLLLVSEDPAVRAALREGRDVSARGDGESGAGLRRAWAELSEVAERAVFRDAAANPRGELEHEGELGVGPQPRAGHATLKVTFPVHDGATGRLVGSVEVHLRVTSLLPGVLSWPGVGGSILALFDAGGEALLLPVPMEPELFARDRFTWRGEDWLVVRHRFHEPPLVIALAAPIGPFTQPFSHAARRGALGFAFVLVLSLVFAWWLTRRMTGPLERLAGAADAVSRGRLDERVTEEGPDEIRRLGSAFNAMTESLRRTLRKLSQREAVAAVGEFAAGLAHEVRNPLTALQLDLERASARTRDDGAQELIARALAEIERLDAVVTGSLRIARSGDIALVPLELRAPLDAAMHAAEPQFRERDAILEPLAGGPSTLRVRGNAGALERLFLNLLRNAAEVLGAGGRATVEIRSEADQVRISVHDDGPGMAAEDLERAFEPFFSTKEEGTGLGLPIARRIAQAHGGDLAIESAPGRGTAVHVLLPRDDGSQGDDPA
jgi:signal transduction histidine kinase